MKSYLKTLLLWGVSALAACALLGCSPDAGSASSPESKAVSMQSITTEGHGFIAGSAAVAKTVYVFFDPQCPHCAHLWEASKPLLKDVKFVWMPVAFAGNISTAEGATILASPNPAEAMQAHELSMAVKGGGIQGQGTEETRRIVAENTKLITAYGFNSIPSLMMDDGKGGVKVHQGQMSTEDLKAWINGSK